ncbi:MAG: hypothetical protein K0S41_3976 [Anaerocolumna sp.]|jgi:beta-lactamase superfamily II metal-dependent hydrolase|nr:hypothetical protein [Anaerocolumna sp.]
MKKKILLSVLTIILLYLSYIFITKTANNPNDFENEVQTASNHEKLQVHFIDVGQADATLITYGDYSMLIDGGNVEDGELVSDYLADQGIKQLDYVIGTHPHEDHIGGIDDIVRNYPINLFFMPDYKMDTDVYKDVINELVQKDLVITKPVVGSKYTLGDCYFTIISPNSSDYGDNANNYSIGIKLTYKDTSFVMAGDAEELSEDEMLKNNIDITADVYKVSHHGSYTSNSVGFLKAIDPTYAVISVGKENKYGHPNIEVLNRLIDDDVQIYRTDDNGTIIVTSDGKNITFNVKKIANESNQSKDNDNNDLEVFVTESGTKYHRKDCSYLNDSKTSLSLNEAKVSGYNPCSKCNPPK